MKIIVFSDIHGDFDKLTRVFNLISLYKPDLSICLGDMIGHGGKSIECIREIRKNHIITVLGNWEMYHVRGLDKYRDIDKRRDFHDEFDSELTENDRKWLESLPFKYEFKAGGKTLLFMHYPIKNINDDYPFYKIFAFENSEMHYIVNEMNYDLKVFGHIHRKQILGNSIFLPSAKNNPYEILIIDINELTEEISYEFLTV